MHQTLKEVLENAAKFTQQLDKIGQGDTLIVYHHAEMDAVMVFPDDVAKRYYELVYVYNTHFAPQALPGVGMAIGDFIRHEDKMYLTVGLGVCYYNMLALHLFRKHEQQFRAWKAQKGDLGTKVQEFISTLSGHDAKLLGIGDLGNVDKWASTFAGWQFVGTPDPHFVRSLADVALTLRGRKKKGDAAIARIATELKEALLPFCYGADALQEIRRQAKHKGIPFIDDDIIGLTSPTASGGASVHNKNAHDDLLHAIPNLSDLVMVAGQTEQALIPHFGGGNVQGENFVMLLPRTPFFNMVQERLDRDESLIGGWSQLLAREEDAKAALNEWHRQVKPLKEEVIKAVIPDFIAHSVLGFNMNLNDKPGIALLRPIVSESALAEWKEVPGAMDFPVIRKKVDDVLFEDGKGYGRMESVFDQVVA